MHLELLIEIWILILNLCSLIIQVINQSKNSGRSTTTVEKTNHDETRGEKEQEWKGISDGAERNTQQKANRKQKRRHGNKKTVTANNMPEDLAKNAFAPLSNEDEDSKSYTAFHIFSLLILKRSIPTRLEFSWTLVTNPSRPVANVVHITNSYTIGGDTRDSCWPRPYWKSQYWVGQDSSLWNPYVGILSRATTLYTHQWG